MYLKFYDSVEKKIIRVDAGKYRPYLITKTENGTQQRRDLILDKDIKVEIVAPENIYDYYDLRRNSNMWEGDVSPSQSYLYDNSLVPGLFYTIDDKTLRLEPTEITGDAREALTGILDKIGTDDTIIEKERYKKHIEHLARTMNEEVPDIHRVAFDIETDSKKMPDVGAAADQITAIAFSGHGIDTAFVMRREHTTTKDTDIEVHVYDDEVKMLNDAAELLLGFPFILTYYGEKFDLPYLYNRAERIGAAKVRHLITKRRDDIILNGTTTHIDMHGIFSNPSLQNYAFAKKYSTYSLDAVSTAMLGEGKIGSGADADMMDTYTLAKYCHNDAKLTYMLSTFDEGIVMQLVIMLSRITSVPIDRLDKTGVSFWIKSMMYKEHRKIGAIIPRQDELSARGIGEINEATSRDKKYKGGFVMEPVPGVHWGVTVMDFASMYPHIIKTHNISYETVRCTHAECKSNKIPQTPHWACTKRTGMLSLLIGAIREMRVKYYKRLSKDSGPKKSQYITINQALKVLMNATYGVMGSEYSAIYFLPVADSVTAIGRHIINGVIEMCEKSGIKILYSDTDSIFVLNTDQTIMEKIVVDAEKKYGLELEIEKQYKYMILTERKKNYLGFKTDSIDIAGMAGKKSNTPLFIRETFSEIVETLSNVSTKEEMNSAKESIQNIIRKKSLMIKERTVPLEQMTFQMILSKDPSQYTSTVPQHVQAARMLNEMGGTIGEGDIISFIKSETGKVRPVELASPEQINTTKYIDFMTSTLDQFLPILGISTADIIAGEKQESMNAFFT